MDKQKLKSEFHKLIDNFEDVETLENVYEGMVNLQKNKNKDILDELSPEQLERLNESLRQAENGEVTEHEVMREKIKRWLAR